MKAKKPKKAAKAEAIGATTPNKRNPVSDQQLKEPWKPGQSGNPGGRPKGSRNKLGEEFVADLMASWLLYGVQAIHTVALTKPADYLAVIAKIIPKDVLVTTRTHEEALQELL